MITRDDNLILQTYYSVTLLIELQKNGFVNSEFFQSMDFEQTGIKEAIRKIGVDNQGSALIALYAMLVVPWQILKDRYPTDFSNIQTFLTNHCNNTITNYPKDCSVVDYVRHIRNSVAHARVEFKPNDIVRFTDNDLGGKHSFKTELPLKYFYELIRILERVHVRYVADRIQEEASN